MFFLDNLCMENTKDKLRGHQDDLKIFQLNHENEWCHCRLCFLLPSLQQQEQFI